MPVKPIPDGYPTLTPYLIVERASEAIDFYRKAFGATEVVRHLRDDGGIKHAEIRIGNSPVMMADESPQMDAKSPEALGGSPVSFFLYVEDVDAWFHRAIEAGATVIRPVRNEDHGDRMGGVADPFGYSWWVATHIEDISPEAMKARSEGGQKPDPE